MPTVAVNVGAGMATQLGTTNVQGWAVYFDASGNSPTWVQLTNTGATLNLPDQQGLKVYFMLQSMAPGVESVQTQIQTESQITPTGTLSSADVLNYRYDSFEVTFTPAPADAGNLTDINGFGIPMEIDVVYADGTSGTRGYSIPGGGVATSDTIWNALVSAGGSGSIQYFTSATSGGLTGPRMAISPATAISENISGTNYHTSNWNNYITNLQTSTAVSAGSGTAAGAEQIQITGYFNGAPDGNHVWHNAGFYSYRVTFSGGNFVLTPDAASQIQGTITISPADLANSIYMTLGNATVSGLANPNGIAGATTTLTMNTGANNEWGAVLRDFLAGFTAGYYDATGTSPNAAITTPLILNKEWNQDPTYAFGGATPNSVTPPTYVYYDEYAKVFFNYTNSYGNGYSDFLTRAFNVGPLINVTDSPAGSPMSTITLTLFGDSDTPTGYTSQTIANYIASTSGGYLVPAGANTNGIQTTLNFNVGQTQLIEGTSIQIVLKGATPAADVVLTTITSFNNYQFASNGSGGYTTTTYGSPVAGVVNLLNLPVTPATSGNGVNWYQIVIGTGAAAKTFNWYVTVDSAGNILNPAYTGQGGSIAIDGLAAITGTGTGQYVTAANGGMTISFFQGGTNTLDPSLLTTVSGTLLPWAPLVGMRPGYTTSDGAPFLQSYEVWSAQTSGTTTPQTVYNGALVFGWNGSDQAALQQQTAASNFYVASYTNKIFGSSYAKLTFSALSGGALPSEIVSNGGYLVAQADADGNWASSVPVSFANGTYTVQMQEFADSGLTSALNSASVVQSFTVAQGAAISTYNLSLETGQTSAGLVIAAGGALTVNGGTASATMISAGGIEYVASGTDRGAIVLGQHQVWSGASATSVTIASGGSGYVYGTTSAVAVNGGGFQYVGGQAHQSVANATTVNSGGNQYVFSSGFASGTTVLSGGKQVVGGATSSGGGGFAMNSLIQAGGQLLVSAGGSAGSSYNSSSFVSGNWVTATLVSGGATIAGGLGYVYSGGVALGTLLQGSGGALNAYSGGSAASTTIQSGTNQYAYQGGSSLAATVQSGGFEVVWGIGSVASGATIQSAGYEYVYEGAQASNTTIQSGGRQLVWDSGTIASNSLVQSFGLMHVHNGGSSVNTTILGGLQVVWSGGTDSNAVINGGSQHVGPTGLASLTTVNSGGFQYNYGNAISTIVNSAGSAITYSGGTTTSAQINAGGTYHVIAGGIASDLTVTGSGGQAYVWSGGSLQGGATVNGGFLEVLSGGVASGTTITFTTSGGTVKFDDSVAIDGSVSISGLTSAAGALIFGDIGYTSGVTSATWNQATSSGGVLTITSGTLQASINLFGNYVAGNFKLATDGATGTLITDPVANNDPFSLLANPHA
jgi:autotransporter passenger strand-loop-strand repeat protein